MNEKKTKMMKMKKKTRNACSTTSTEGMPMLLCNSFENPSNYSLFSFCLSLISYGTLSWLYSFLLNCKRERERGKKENDGNENKHKRLSVPSLLASFSSCHFLLSLPFSFSIPLPPFVPCLFCIRFQFVHDKSMMTIMMPPIRIRLFKTIPLMIAGLIRFPLSLIDSRYSHYYYYFHHREKKRNQTMFSKCRSSLESSICTLIWPFFDIYVCIYIYICHVHAADHCITS